MDTRSYNGDPYQSELSKFKLFYEVIDDHTPERRRNKKQKTKE